MNVRGTVTGTGERRAVTTSYGERDLAPVRISDGEGRERRVALWGDWAETADVLSPGAELLVTDAAESEYGGETEYATTGDSSVVLEPSYLVDVTEVRSWVQCPRMHYLDRISGTPLAYPVVRGTIIHQVFGDLLRGVDPAATVEDRVEEAGLELGLLGRDPGAVREEVRQHARALDGWLRQGTLTGDDDWRSEYTLMSGTYGLKGRCDAVRRGMPVELKTGRNTGREPRFHDKVQAACYALLLREEGVDADTGVVLYTNNATLDRGEAGGDLAAAKEFSIGGGLLDFVVRKRNELVGMALDREVPTGREADADCARCFERDHCMVVSGRLGQDGKAGAVGSAVPEEEREYFRGYYEFAEDERRAIHGEYAKLWEQTPEERAAEDRALIGLDPAGRERLDDGRWELRARKPADAVSKIREGDLVLASGGDPLDGEPARVERLDGDGDVVVTADEPVELRRLDVYPSELSVDRTLTAVYEFVLKGDGRRKDLLFGRAEPAFRDDEGEYIANNGAQNRAVNAALNAEDYALIHGPPGTGKTYTIARAIRALVDRGERVLLASLTNRAVDNVLEALREQGFEEFVRVGTATGIDEAMLPARLDTRGAGAAETLRDAPVVAATTATCGSRVVREAEFDVAVVDEAAQLTEPDTLAAVNLADRFVLVGDHRQLPSVTRAEAPPSMFERLVEESPDAGVMLETQYRMAQRIQAFPSREFYDGALRPATGEVAGGHLADLDPVEEGALPGYLRDRVTFVDVDGEAAGNVNRAEAERVVEVVADLRSAGVPAGDIGVIAPFRAQVAEISRRLDGDVTVDTVDRFQGSSEEVIVISFVATDDLSSPIFDDHRRLNVALTRPRKALVLVGNADALATEDVYARMLDWSGRRPE